MSLKFNIIMTRTFHVYDPIILFSVVCNMFMHKQSLKSDCFYSDLLKSPK